MKCWVYLFFLLSPLLCGASSLKERLEKAKVGDYIVAEANKMVSLISIRSLTPSTLILEEISAPLQNLKKTPSSWAEWIKAKAPGHTSWSMIEIDLETAEILECYSFSRSSWVQLSAKESLFATLLHLPLHQVPPQEQRKIGPPPLAGESDFRKPWKPSLIFEGKKLENARFEVYQAVWPKDGSDLSGEKICLYFDEEKKVSLPLWIQVETTHAAAALRAIDSGKNLPIVYRNIPRRVPEFIGPPLKTQQGLRLNLKCPSYYKQFELYAIDITTSKKQIFPITHSLIKGEGEWKSVEIDEEELKQTLECNHRYTWLLVPTGHAESYTETSKPFVWTEEKDFFK